MSHHAQSYLSKQAHPPVEGLHSKARAQWIIQKETYIQRDQTAPVFRVCIVAQFGSGYCTTVQMKIVARSSFCIKIRIIQIVLPRRGVLEKKYLNQTLQIVDNPFLSLWFETIKHFLFRICLDHLRLAFNPSAVSTKKSNIMPIVMRFGHFLISHFCINMAFDLPKILRDFFLISREIILILQSSVPIGNKIWRRKCSL